MFRKFKTCASVGRLLAWLWEKGYQLPKPERRGDYSKYQMVDANYTCLVHMLQNPKYAGVYVYPRVRRETIVLADGRVVRKSRANAARRMASLSGGPTPGLHHAGPVRSQSGKDCHECSPFRSRESRRGQPRIGAVAWPDHVPALSSQAAGALSQGRRRHLLLSAGPATARNAAPQVVLLFMATN